MTPEGKVKAAVKKILNAYANVTYVMPVQGGFGVQGVHDFLICCAGNFLTIECKPTHKIKATALQQAFAAAVVMAGGKALLIHADNLTLVETYLRMMGAVPK